MAVSGRVTVPSDGTAVRLDNIPGIDPDRSYGISLLLYNPGTVVVELGGSNISGTNSFRGFLGQASIGVDLAEGETLHARVTGSLAGSVDVLRVK